MEQIKAYIQTATNFYKMIHPAARHEIKNFSGEKMTLLVDEDLDDKELSDKLGYYSAWMTYFQAEMQRWKFVSEWLDNLYKDEYNKSLVRDSVGKKFEKVAQIELELSELKKARMVSLTKAESAKNGLQTAITQREVVSRRITIRGFDK